MAAAVPGAAEAVASVSFWYHTMDLGKGVVTPGWFDLRPIVDRLPWPDVRDRRCLDVGTYDGFLAFELERRGAGEVVALDIADHEDWDWPPDQRAHGGEHLARLAGVQKDAGFRAAHQALGSSVEKVDLSAYELSPERVGSFDVVVCGSLLLHLRDPLRALEAIRAVCTGELMSCEQVGLGLSLVHPRKPLATLDGSGPRLQWWVPNAAGHRRMLLSAGFETFRHTRPFCEPFGPSHPARRLAPRALPRRLAQRALTGNTGVPHAAALARARV